MTDKEKIRAEVERHKEHIRIGLNAYDAGYENGRFELCNDLLSFIDSMPEEPTPKGYDEAYLNECIAKASKTWEGVDVDKYMNEVRVGESDDLKEAITAEEPSESLEEAAEEYFYRNWSDGSLDIKPQVKEDFKAGAEWQKSQMMKEAVEGTIVDAGFDDHTALVSIPDKRYDEGDKVHIIIVKEKEE